MKITIHFLYITFYILLLNGCKQDAIKPDCWLILDEVKTSREAGNLDLARKKLNSLQSCLESNHEEKGMKYYYHLGWVLHENKEYGKAIEAYTKGLEYQPEYVFAYWRRGLAYEQLNNQLSAEEDFKSAMRIGQKTMPDFINTLEQYPEIKVKLIPYKEQ
jgi:tetratricopeptide (TPR) repeat protein